jgi:hypothetical protein
VKSLTFTIHPLAYFSGRGLRPRSTRALYNFEKITAKQSQSPFRVTFGGTRPSMTRNTPSLVSTDIVQTSSILKFGTVRHNQSTPNKQLQYQKCRISTSKNQDGTWIALYGISDGTLLERSGKVLAVLDTSPCVCEVLAIAAAQIAIDDLAEKPNIQI